MERPIGLTRGEEIHPQQSRLRTLPEFHWVLGRVRPSWPMQTQPGKLYRYRPALGSIRVGIPLARKNREDPTWISQIAPTQTLGAKNGETGRASRQNVLRKVHRRDLGKRLHKESRSATIARDVPSAKCRQNAGTARLIKSEMLGPALTMMKLFQRQPSFINEQANGR